MMSVIHNRSFSLPPVCEKEVLRYAGCREADPDTERLMRECIKEIEGRIAGKVCWREFPAAVCGSICDFDSFQVSSDNLAINLRGCSSVILFAATVGVDMDRVIVRYSRISPAKALMMQAIGAERIEALCDAFCEDIADRLNVKLKPRFSPGYGDLSIEIQKDIFAVLDCPRQIGLTLNDSLLMSPSKSVTAFIGVHGSFD